MPKRSKAKRSCRARQRDSKGQLLGKMVVDSTIAEDQTHASVENNTVMMEIVENDDLVLGKLFLHVYLGRLR